MASLLVTGMMAWLSNSEAVTLTVYNNNDAGAGSLRQAIADNRALGGGNTVVFSNTVTGTITLVASDLVITNHIDIQGPGAKLLTLSGNNANRIFTIANANVSLSGLTIAYGKTNGFGGGMYLFGGSLTMNSCVVVSNMAAFGSPGGGIWAQGTLIATNCTFLTNAAAGGSGGGGNISSSGPLTLVNCAVINGFASGISGGGIGTAGTSSGLILNSTFYGNRIAGFGGGIYVANGVNLTVTSSTFTKNAATLSGGGIHNLGAVTIRNTIMAGNTNSSGTNWDCFGSFNSGGYNLIGARGVSTGWGSLGDQTGTTNSPINALLSTAANNGGPTLTVAPLAGSPAIDQGKSFGLPNDQRAHNRPYDKSGVPNATGGDGSDIGALEMSPGTLTVINNNDQGPGSLRQAVADASGFDEDIITFAPQVVGAIVLTSGVLAIDKSLSISGPGATKLVLSGNGNQQVIETLDGNVSISGLTIANGRVAGATGGVEQNGAQARGGGIFNQTTLVLNDCIFSNNVAIGGQGGQTGSGFAGGGGNGLGGAIANIAPLNATNCVFVSNAASGGNGGVATSGGENGQGGQGYGGAVHTAVGLLNLVRCSLVKNSANGGNGGGGTGSGSGGGLYNDADVVLLNSTVVSNSAAGSPFDFGGGIYHNGVTLTIRSATIWGNQADFGGGISASGPANLGNTILAGNTAGSGPDCSGTLDSSDYNLIQNTSDTTITGTTTHNIIGQNPLLGVLQDNGGATLTMVVPLNSPVLDRGKSFSLSTDQRGAPRPFDFSTVANAGGGDGSDIGAFEFGRPALSIQRGGGGAVLSWPFYYGDFSLQSTTNMAAANSWVTVLGTPVISGNQYFQTNSPISTNRFFRLKSL